MIECCGGFWLRPWSQDLFSPQVILDERLWLSLAIAVAMDVPVMEKQEGKLGIPLLETHEIITLDAVCGLHRKWFAVLDT